MHHLDITTHVTLLNGVEDLIGCPMPYEPTFKIEVPDLSLDTITTKHTQHLSLIHI